jgi:Fur family zinc uptake transcriptional regulator
MTVATCPHRPQSIRPRADVAAAVNAAQRLCQDHGERWTGPRQRTYELLVEAGRPMKAYDLIGVYGPDGSPVSPPTVYRALDFLQLHGLAHRLETQNAFVACSAARVGHSAELLICDCCGVTEELHSDISALAGQEAQRRGYAVRQVVLEISGRCPACA